jgi:hypothetical protein
MSTVLSATNSTMAKEPDILNMLQNEYQTEICFFSCSKSLRPKKNTFASGCCPYLAEGSVPKVSIRGMKKIFYAWLNVRTLIVYGGPLVPQRKLFQLLQRKLF